MVLFFHQKKKLVFFSLLLQENMCCGYSLEVPQRDMFSWRATRTSNMFSLKTISTCINMYVLVNTLLLRNKKSIQQYPLLSRVMYSQVS